MGHWFEPLADHMGEAYLRYSFTKGTVQEVDHIVDALGLEVGQRVLDVGCGPGRHAYELAQRGIVVHGIDISERFVEIARASAPDGATFERLDARSLEFDAEFDAVICLCQGAFGLMTADGEDATVVAGLARALRPGGRLALSAFSSYFVVKHWESTDFDADTGVNHEHTEVRDRDGRAMGAELWTGCYTPRELRLLLGQHGLGVDSISSVEPGAYSFTPPTVDSAEFLAIATRT
ncbi:MAG: class I SAM-dependent methyltransferase [Ilumatobacter sp.]|uniref:class I SAM-dependent methyltransferase n=1 Tax=Ilumatobacter sp. TaxID=1967498 RepID=UPI00391AAC8C